VLQVVLCTLEVLDGCTVLLRMLEVMGSVCHVLEVLEGVRCTLLCMLEVIHYVL
jgi:hypothetical protein